MKRIGEITGPLLGLAKTTTLTGETKAHFEATLIVCLETKLRPIMGDDALNDFDAHQMWWDAVRADSTTRAEWLEQCRLRMRGKRGTIDG